jgi:hypothetical protein
VPPLPDNEKSFGAKPAGKDWLFYAGLQDFFRPSSDVDSCARHP